MATKAELETELAELRRQMAERDRMVRAEPVAEAADAAPEAEEQPNGEDWETLVTELMKEVEELPHKKPLLVAAGIFALGWLIGRSAR